MKNIYPSTCKILLPKPSTVKFLIDYSRSLAVLKSKNGIFVLSKN